MTNATDAARATYLVKVGGSLGVAASFIGLAVFLAGMFGLDAVFMLSILPLALGGIGLVVTIVGAVLHTPGGADEVTPIAAIFCCMFGLIFGAIGWYVWAELARVALGNA